MKKFLCKSCNTYIERIYDSIHGCSAGLDFECKFSNYYDWIDISFNNKKAYITLYSIYDNINILHLFTSERTNSQLNLTDKEIEFYSTHFYYSLSNCDEFFDSVYNKDFHETIKKLKIVEFKHEEDLCYDFESTSVLYYLEDEIKKIESKIEKNLIFI